MQKTKISLLGLAPEKIEAHVREAVQGAETEADAKRQLHERLIVLIVDVKMQGQVILVELMPHQGADIMTVTCQA